MKRFLTIAFLLMVIPLFVACGGSDEESEESGDMADTQGGSEDNGSGGYSNSDSGSSENQGLPDVGDTEDNSDNSGDSGSDGGDSDSSQNGGTPDQDTTTPDQDSAAGNQDDGTPDEEAGTPDEETETDEDAAETGDDTEETGDDDTETGDDTEETGDDDTETGDDDTETADDTEEIPDTDTPETPDTDTPEPSEECTEITLGDFSYTDYGHWVNHYDKFQINFTPNLGSSSYEYDDYLYLYMDGVDSDLEEKPYYLEDYDWNDYLNDNYGVFLYLCEDRYYDYDDGVYYCTKLYFQREGTFIITDFELNLASTWLKSFEATLYGVVLEEIYNSGNPVPGGSCIKIWNTTLTY